MFAFKTLIPLALAAVSVQAASFQKRAISGRGTFYDVGANTGNCGQMHSGNENVVALNTAQYGSTSQVSGACFQTITINYNGKSEQAEIVDSCPTCPYGALDLSKSLFSKLTDGNMGLGEIQLSWSWGSGSSGSSSSSSSSKNKDNNDSSSNNKSSNNNNNNNNNNDNNDNKKSSDNNDSNSQAPTNTAQKTTIGKPSWWANIDKSACPNVDLPEGVNAVSIGPGDNAAVEDLPSTCGKWVQIWNVQNNKSTKAMLTSYQPNAEKNSIYMSDAYLEIADTEGNNPEMFQKAKWGFLN